MEKSTKSFYSRIVTLVVLLAIGVGSAVASGAAVKPRHAQSGAANASEEVIEYDFAANPDIIAGLATGITDWSTTNRHATIVINGYSFTLHNCLRGNGYLSVRGDYNDKDAGSDPGYVQGSMKGIMTKLTLTKRVGGGNVNIIFEKEDGSTVTHTSSVASGSGTYAIEIPADKQVADAKSITIKPDFKLNVSKIAITRQAVEQSKDTPWVKFKLLKENTSDEDIFKAGMAGNDESGVASVSAGQIVQLINNGIEGFDPVSTMGNQYVVTYVVVNADKYKDAVSNNTLKDIAPTFSMQTNSAHKYWKNGDDKGEDGITPIGNPGYVYRRGIVLSKENTTNNEGDNEVDNIGDEITVLATVWQITSVTGNKCEATELQTIAKTFKFESTPKRPNWGASTTGDTRDNITFIPYSKQKTYPGKIDGTDDLDLKNTTILDPTENITVKQVEWPEDDNTIIAKLSENDSYNLQSLLNSASVSPTKGQKSMKSSSLKLRKVSAIMYTPNGLVSNRVAESYYWFVPARKQLHIKATATENMTDYDLTIDMSQKPSQEVTLNAYYTDSDNNNVTVSLKDLNLTKKDIIISDSEVAEIDGDITFDDKGNAKFTLKAKDNGYTQLTVSTKKTNNVNAKKADATAESAENYTAATTSFDVKVIGGENLMPPSITPYSQQYSHTFNATIKGVEGVKTYYFVYNPDNPSMMLVEGQDESTGSSEITAQEVISAAIDGPDGTNIKYCGIIDGTNEAIVPIVGKDNATFTVYAVAANADSNGNLVSGEKNSSRVVSAVYTFNRLENPVLSPGVEGVANSFPFSDNLDVEANVESTNAKIFYTTDKDIYLTFEDGVVVTNGTLFNSSTPIHVNQNSYVQAIAVNDSLRLTSDIVTYRYIKTSGDIGEPMFKIGGAEYTNGDKYTKALTGTNQVTLLAHAYDSDGGDITIGGTNDNTANSNYCIYYSTDGSYPIKRKEDGNIDDSHKYTEPFNVDNNKGAVTIKAVAYNITDGTVSDLSVLYALNSAIQYWETSDGNCKNGILKSLNQSITSSDGADLMLIEFGGSKSKDSSPLAWKHYVSKEYATGNPIDNIGKYTIAPALDADEEVADVKDENGLLWNHSRANNPAEKDFQTHKATFGLPASGAYVKFEPKQNGTITVWCCQEGALFYSNKSTDRESFNEGFLRKRPAYFVDEAGHSIKPADVQAAGVLSYNWNTNATSGYWNVKGEDINNIPQTLYTQDQTDKIYNMFNQVILKNDAKLNSPLQPLLVYLNTEENKTVAGFNVAEDPKEESDKNPTYTPDPVIDGTGVCLPSASYMKYTFDVKAGKTYYFFGWMTKIGIRGIGFEPDTQKAANGSYTIKGGKAGTDDSSTENTFDDCFESDGNGKTYASVTLNRTFQQDTWAVVTLPFSVSASELKRVFGDGTQVLHYRTIDGSTMHFFKHFHQMIVAGTPVLIKPANGVNNPVFNNVTFDVKTAVDTPCNDYALDGTANNSYPMIGSFTPQEYHNGDFYISTAGTVKRLNRTANTPAVLNGTRAYIKGTDDSGTPANVSRMVRAQYDDPTLRDMDGNTTLIDIVPEDGDGDDHTSAMGRNRVYSIGGQLLRSNDTNTTGLQKGVYVVDGKKTTVK